MLLKETILNKKGLKLSTLFNFPDKKEKFPVMILLQGFLGNKDGEKVASLSNHLEQLGIATARFDPAGFGESEGETINEYLISNILTDTENVYKSLLKNKLVDITKIGIWGQSMGGMLAIIFASKHPKIKALCTVSPPAQITVGDNLAELLPEWKNKGFLLRQSSKNGEIKISYDFVSDAQKWDAGNSITKINIPTLVILGTKDNTIPPEITKDIFLRAKQPKELVEIQGMGHDYKENPEQLKRVNQLTGDFFLKVFSFAT